MADTPSNILLLRLQSTGSNTNLWGGYLNTALQTLEQAAKGYQSLTISGDTTVSWSNYSTGNTGQAARVKVTGTLLANATITMPAYMNVCSFDNQITGGFAITVKCSGGTGVTIANGYAASLFCDGVDYFHWAPSQIGGALTVAGQVHGVTAGTAPTDGVNLAQMQAAIAASVPAGTAGTILNSGSDTTRDYLNAKHTLSNTGLLVAALTTQNPGANENLQLSLDDRRVRRRALFVGQV
jgi:hypothetical protein